MACGGFSLVELLIVGLVVLGLIGMLMMSFVTSRNAYLLNDESLYIQQEVRRALEATARELPAAGRVRQVGGAGGVDFANQTRVDFQLDRGFDQGTCGGICWGTDDPAFPTGWLHYLLNTTNPQNTQLVRCATTNQGSAINFATCRVLANNIQTFLVDYAAGTRTVTLHLQIRKVSAAIPGGSVTSSTSPQVRQVKLRNAS